MKEKNDTEGTEREGKGNGREGKERKGKVRSEWVSVRGCERVREWKMRV